MPAKTPPASILRGSRPRPPDRVICARPRNDRYRPPFTAAGACDYLSTPLPFTILDALTRAFTSVHFRNVSNTTEPQALSDHLHVLPQYRCAHQRGDSPARCTTHNPLTVITATSRCSPAIVGVVSQCAGIWSGARDVVLSPNRSHLLRHHPRYLRSSPNAACRPETRKSGSDASDLMLHTLASIATCIKHLEANTAARSEGPSSSIRLTLHQCLSKHRQRNRGCRERSITVFRSPS